MERWRVLWGPLGEQRERDGTRDQRAGKHREGKRAGERAVSGSLIMMTELLLPQSASASCNHHHHRDRERDN